MKGLCIAFVKISFTKSFRTLAMSSTAIGIQYAAQVVFIVHAPIVIVPQLMKVVGGNKQLTVFAVCFIVCSSEYRKLPYPMSISFFGVDR